MKKILWTILLVTILAALIIGVVVSKKQEEKVADAVNSFNKNTETLKATEEKEEITEEDKAEISTEDSVSAESEDTTSNKIYKETKLSDGTLYSFDGKQITADVVLTDNYYDTTINDMWLNPDSYIGKTVQIEGMYLENLPYTFVGRYSESNLCPNCPAGYSYFEYQLNGELNRKFTDEKEWIKVIGKFAVGNDASTNYTDFYYLDVLTLEVMNERGQETINN